MAKDLKLLLSPPIERPRITDELADIITAGDEARAPVALLVSPFGKVWRVEVGRDGDGAFLGRGWLEFVAAHGIGVDWFVVLRHEGGGVLTVKVFDTSFCIKEFHSPDPASSIMANSNVKGAYCKPQFIRVMHLDFMERMMIPMEFVKRYLTGENINMTVIHSPLDKFWRVKLEKDQSGLFFSGDWSHFVVFHGISVGDVFLIRYEGNMVFKFKAFSPSGSTKDFKDHDTRIKQDAKKQQEGNPCSFSRKRNRNEVNPCCEENDRSKGSITSLSRAAEPDYQTGPSSWIKKELTTYTLERYLSLSPKFCRCIGFHKSCTIVLKTNLDSTRSWNVHGLAYKHVHYLGDGWNKFCQDNNLKEGDICTFNIVKTMLWHVTIMRLTDNEEQQKSPSPHSTMKCMTKNDSSSIKGQKGPDDTRISYKNSPSTRSVYEIGPPSWIQKQMTTSSLQDHLYLAQRFFVAIGLQSPCTITLKTSIHSAKSWQVHVLKESNGSCQLGESWCRFWQENGLKEGDVCTFKVINTTLWQVIIARP